MQLYLCNGLGFSCVGKPEFCLIQYKADIGNRAPDEWKIFKSLFFISFID